MKTKVRARQHFGELLLRGEPWREAAPWKSELLLSLFVFSKAIHCLPIRSKSSIFQLKKYIGLHGREYRARWNEILARHFVSGAAINALQWAVMEMEKRRMPIRREVSWSPGGLRKPLSATQNTQTPETECNAPWEKTEFNEEQMSRKASKSLFIFFIFLWGF